MRALSSFALAVLLLAPEAARAESAARDAGPQCAYTAPEIDPPAGDLPANWPALVVGLTGSGFDPSSATLVRVSDNRAVPITASLGVDGTVYAIREPLVVGEDYLFTHPVCPRALPGRTTLYTAVAPIEAPTLDPIVIAGPYAANQIRGVANREYFLALTIMPSAGFAATPWSRFVWGAEVDGFLPDGQVEAMSHTSLRVPLACASARGVTEGMHAIGASAGPTLTVADVHATPMPFTVVCADAQRVDSDTLAPLTPDEIAYWDTSEMDVSVPDMDAGAEEAGGVDGGNLGMHTEPDTHSNCSASPASSSPGGMLIALALLGAGRALGRARRKNEGSRA